MTNALSQAGTTYKNARNTLETSEMGSKEWMEAFDVSQKAQDKLTPEDREKLGMREAGAEKGGGVREALSNPHHEAAKEIIRNIKD